MTDTLTKTALDRDVNYFVSGSNRPGEIRGLALSGHNVGMSVSELSATAELELLRFAGAGASGMKVFADSGAFGEVSFATGELAVVEEISHVEWVTRLATYERLALAFGSALYVVAPDRVGDQAVTLERLERYAPQMRRIAALGANVIVPVQKGALGMPAFFELALETLELDDIIAGVPMKKDATSLAELAELAEHLEWTGRAGARLHLLGLGTRGARYAAAVAAIRAVAPSIEVFSDSVRITAMVGRDGKNGKPRKLTAATDAVKAAGKCANATEWKSAALWSVMMDEHREDLQQARAAGWFDDELESAPGVPLEPGCVEYGAGGPFGTTTIETTTQPAKAA